MEDELKFSIQMSEQEVPQENNAPANYAEMGERPSQASSTPFHMEIVSSSPGPVLVAVGLRPVEGGTPVRVLGHISVQGVCAGVVWVGLCFDG